MLPGILNQSLAMEKFLKKAGYNSPEEMNGLAKEIRKELWEEHHENNKRLKQ